MNVENTAARARVALSLIFKGIRGLGDGGGGGGQFSQKELKLESGERCVQEPLYAFEFHWLD